MKNLIFIFSILLSYFSMEAQQILLQNQDIELQVSPIEYQVFRNATVEITPCVNLHQRTGSIDLNFTDKEGNLQTKFEVIKFNDSGGAAFVTNETDWLNFQEQEVEALKQLQGIQELVTHLGKRRTEELYLDNTSNVLDIDNQISDLLAQETLIRSNPIFDPANRIDPNWVYANTFDKLLNQYLNGYELNQQGINLVLNRVIYRSNEDGLITMRIGEIKDFFVEDNPVVPTGTFSNDSPECYVLGENNSMTFGEKRTYTLGRQGLCQGRTNLNGDNFTITGGQVITTVGLEESGGVYTPISEDFTIVIDGAFTISKGLGGQFMVFSVKPR